jgi:hypothetical protein
MKSLVFCGSVVCILLLGCKKKTNETPRKVTYKIQCTDCYVVWEENGVQKNMQHVNSNWTTSFDGMKDSMVLVCAMNTAGTPQGVGATILLNDDTLKHAMNYCPISGTVVVADTLE